MKVPNADRAVIPEAKLRDYLLSEAHPVGRFKSAFFRSLGYLPHDPQTLENGLRLLLDNDAEREISTEYGLKYEVRGILTGPGGRSAGVVSVWIVVAGEDFPRFVTAYPE